MDFPQELEELINICERAKEGMENIRMNNQGYRVGQIQDAMNYLKCQLQKEYLQYIIREEWKYVTIILDRILLSLFSFSCIAGMPLVLNKRVERFHQYTN